MFKLRQKIKFNEKDDRMANVGAVEKVIKSFKLRSQPNFSVYVMAE